MGVSLDSLMVQPPATGTFEGASGTVTLPVGTEAGSQILILAGLGGDGTNNANIATPSGFAAITVVGDSPYYGTVFAWVKLSASAGETSWGLTVTGSTSLVTWAVFECAGLDLDWPNKALIAASERSGTTVTVTSKTTNNFDLSESFSALTLAVFMAAATDATVPTIGSYTDGFNEIATQTGSDAARGFRMSVAARQELTISTPNSTATISPTSYVATLLLTFTGVDSLHAPTVLAMSGGEIGTATSITSGGTTNDGDTPPWDTVAGTPAIVSTSPRSGSFCYELSSTAAAENLAWIAGSGKNLQTTTIDVLVARLNIYFPTSLPASDVLLASIEAGSAANAVDLWYRTATTKIGVKIGGGTEQASDAVVTAGQWSGVDLRYDPRTTTHVCDWQVDYDATVGDATGPVPQAQATTASMTAAAVSTFRIGWTAATTATVRYDDIIVSRFRKAYPLGAIEIRPLKVDPAGTPTVSGSSANFRTWTANGTMAAWTAAATVTALDDIPPTIGAASDGLAQTANAATEYVEVPMQTLTLAPDYVAIAGRWSWCGWAASANPATFRFRRVDGAGALPGTLGDAVDAGFDDTALSWRTSIHNSDANLGVFYQLTQAKVDGLAARFGFGGDQLPDAGVHAVLFELAVKPTDLIAVFGEPSGTPRVEEERDPSSNALVALHAYTAAGQTATLTWYDGAGNPTSTAIPAASNPHTVTVNAVDLPAAPRIQLVVD